MALDILGPPRVQGTAVDPASLQQWMDQLHALLTNIDIDNRLTALEAAVTAMNTNVQALLALLGGLAQIAPLTTAISNPPTQAEVTEIRNKINAILLVAQIAN